MKRILRRGCAALAAALGLLAAGSAAAGEISLFFSPSGARVGDPVTLQFNLVAASTFGVTNGTVSLAYPGIVNSAVGFNGCGTAVVDISSPSAVVVTGVDLAANTQCVIQLTVSAATAGTFTVTTPPGTFTAALPVTQTNTIVNTATLCATAPLTVTNTNDSGPGSLRDALTQANNGCAAPVDILFNVPTGGATAVIKPLSPLPALANSFGIAIDGYSQPGASKNTVGVTGLMPPTSIDTVIKVELDGSLCASCSGLTLSSFSAQVAGLAIHSFPVYQVDAVSGGSISGNFIGTDATGAAVRAGGLAGVHVGLSSFASIGGPPLLGPTQNLIVNQQAGVLCDGSCFVSGNLIGGTASGAPGLGNGNGVRVSASASADVTENVVRYNTGAGIVYDLAFSGSAVGGNVAYANGGPGIDIGNDGPTPNDEAVPPYDQDGVLNTPIITNVYHVGANTRVDGYLKSANVFSAFSPGQIGFYANPTLPTTTEGAFLFHYETLTPPDADGLMTFSFTLPGTFNFISAQVSADTCSDGCDASSEFSPAVAAVLVPPSLAIAPPAATFPNTQVGSAATPLTITLTNSGTVLPAPLQVLGLGPVAPPFTAATTCSAALAPGASCTVTVTFAPTAVGTFTGTLVLSTDDPAQPTYSIAISGVAVPVPAPAVTLAPTALTFASQLVGTTSGAQPVTLTNGGTAPLAIASVVASAGFVVGNTCPASLAAGASCVLNVSFQPVAAGPVTGTLTVTSNAAGSPHTATLTATAVAPVPVIGVLPTTLAFAARTVNTASAAQTVTVANTGTGVASLLSITVTGDFQIQSLCGATLAPAATCTIDVKFVPLVAGARTGQLAIATNAAGSPHVVALSGTGIAVSIGTLDVSPTSLDFGSVAPGATSAAQLVAILNTGTAPVNFSVAASGPGFALAPAPASVTACAGVLNAGAACSVAVTFQPGAEGLVTGALQVASDASNPNLSVTLVGTGFVAPLPRNLAVATRLEFGSQAVGVSTPAQALSLTNTSGATLAITEASVAGDFSVSDGCATIPARATCTLLVTFTPTARGARTGFLTLRVLGEALAYFVTLAGDGGPNPTPVLAVSPARIGFGNAFVGPPTATRAIQLTNVGEVPVTLGGYSGPGDFLLVNHCGPTLPVGERCTVDVSFYPRVLGLRAGFLNVLSDAGNGPHRVELSGVGCGLPGVASNRLPQVNCTP